MKIMKTFPTEEILIQPPSQIPDRKPFRSASTVCEQLTKLTLQ